MNGTIVRALLAAALGLLALTGCGISVPADPDGTLQRVRGGLLRVGYSPSPEWVEAGLGAEPGGREADLVRQFASHLNATVEWSEGGEELLMGRLKKGDLDLVVGGLTAKSPWHTHAAITRPYVTVRDADGRDEKHVMAAPMGENAFLVELETFLLAREVQP